MTTSDIINAVRVRLGDISQERWTEQQLMLYTSLAQNTICTLTHFYRKDDYITLVEGQYVYDLPTDCLVVNRLEYNDQFFPIESRNSIDRGEATFPCALKDNLAYNKIEVVLDPTASDLTLKKVLDNAYGVVTASDTDAIDTSDCELEDVYGVVTNVGEEAEPTPEQLGALHVYYSAVPPLIEDTNVPLILPDAYFGAFFHYVTGMALQDDNDANNIQRGELELQKANGIILDIYKKSAKDYTSNVKSKLIMPRRI